MASFWAQASVDPIISKWQRSDWLIGRPLVKGIDFVFTFEVHGITEISNTHKHYTYTYAWTELFILGRCQRTLDISIAHWFPRKGASIQWLLWNILIGFRGNRHLTWMWTPHGNIIKENCVSEHVGSLCVQTPSAFYITCGEMTFPYHCAFAFLGMRVDCVSCQQYRIQGAYTSLSVVTQTLCGA